MVLSNKKLKRRLSEVKAESVASEAAAHSSEAAELHELLDAKKKRQPKRLKRKRKTERTRKTDEELPNDEEPGVGSGGGDDVEENGVNEKKKRRGNHGNGTEIDVDRKNENNVKIQKIMKKMKKIWKLKKMKKKNKKKIGDPEEDLTDQRIDTVAHINEMEETSSSKVYVGGIPYYSSEDDIRSYFEGCGSITEIDCMTFSDSGKFRGIAIISFKTEAASKRALALDGSDMGGFYLKILPYKTTRSNKVSNFTPQRVEGYNRIYVGNLSWEITEDDLKLFFSNCKVSSIRFGTNKETGEFRGYAHVDFSDSASITEALKLDQHIVCGRPVKISCAIPKNGAKFTPIAAPAIKEPEEIVSTPVSGKIRRRTCYECGEKGHLSTACPNKPKADSQ